MAAAWGLLICKQCQESCFFFISAYQYPWFEWASPKRIHHPRIFYCFFSFCGIWLSWLFFLYTELAQKRATDSTEASKVSSWIVPGLAGGLCGAALYDPCDRLFGLCSLKKTTTTTKTHTSMPWMFLLVFFSKHVVHNILFHGSNLDLRREYPNQQLSAQFRCKKGFEKVHPSSSHDKLINLAWET